ncbi:TadE/TadG family type IV pilus assembly protein [Azospirillum sp. sgz302134]
MPGLLFPKGPLRLMPGRLFRDRRGSAMLEAAIVLPLLTSLTFGLIEMGRALQHQHIMSKSVRDAARYLARVPLSCPATGDANWAAARSTAQTLALTGQVDGTKPLVSYWTAGSFTIGTPTCQTLSGRPVQVMSVTGSVDYQSLGFLALLNIQAFKIQAAHQEMHIGE